MRLIKIFIIYLLCHMNQGYSLGLSLLLRTKNVSVEAWVKHIQQPDLELIKSHTPKPIQERPKVANKPETNLIADNNYTKPTVFVQPQAKAHIRPKTQLANSFRQASDNTPIKSIHMGVGDRKEFSGRGRQIFIRNPEILEFQNGELIATAPGSTEIYMVENGIMKIIPVGIEQDLEAVPTTLMPAGFQTSLDDSTPPEDSVEIELSHVQEDIVPLQVITQFGNETRAVADLNVQIAGQKQVYRTDRKGFVQNLKVPSDSRFWVTITDPQDIYKQTTTEVISSAGLQTIKIVSNQFDQSIMRSLNLQPLSQSESLLCVDIKNNHAKDLRLYTYPDSQLILSFNSLGIPIATQKTLESNRVCFWGIPNDSPVLIFAENNDVTHSLPVAIGPGFKLIDWDLEHVMPVSNISIRENTTHPLMVTTPIDYSPIEPIGDYSELEFTKPNCAQNAETISLNQGRAWFLSKEDIFESVIYQINENQSHHSIPLLRRGFLDLMTEESNWDQDLGSVLIEHRPMTGQNTDSPDIYIVDVFGNEYSSAFTWDNADNHLTGFINLPAGGYQVLVRDQLNNGEFKWIKSDTLLVYDQTTSYVQTGSLQISNSKCGK